MRTTPPTVAALLFCSLFALGCDSVEVESELDLELRAGQTATLSTTRSGSQTFRPITGDAPCPPPQVMTPEPPTWPVALLENWQKLLPEAEAEWAQSVQGKKMDEEFEQICWNLCDEHQLAFTGDLEIFPLIEPLELPYEDADCGGEFEPIMVDTKILVELATDVDCTCAMLQ